MNSRQNFVAPLRNELVGHHDQGLEIFPLAPQCVEHHESLDRLAEAYLVGEQVSNPHVREHPLHIRESDGCIVKRQLQLLEPAAYGCPRSFDELPEPVDRDLRSNFSLVATLPGCPPTSQGQGTAGLER